jgi:hypothetical protein
MKTYVIGANRIGVYEPRDLRPDNAMQAVSDDSSTCFVDRVVDEGGLLDTAPMIEALARHRRLKIGTSGPFELQLIESLAEAAESLPGWLTPWGEAFQTQMTRTFRNLFQPGETASPDTDRIADA